MEHLSASLNVSRPIFSRSALTYIPCRSQFGQTHPFYFRLQDLFVNQATLGRNFFVVKREFANQYSRQIPECWANCREGRIGYRPGHLRSGAGDRGGGRCWWVIAGSFCGA